MHVLKQDKKDRIAQAIKDGNSCGWIIKNLSTSAGTIARIRKEIGAKKEDDGRIGHFGKRAYNKSGQVTTSHVRLPPADAHSSALYWFDDLENLNRKSKMRKEKVRHILNG